MHQLAYESDCEFNGIPGVPDDWLVSSTSIGKSRWVLVLLVIPTSRRATTTIHANLGPEITSVNVPKVEVAKVWVRVALQQISQSVCGRYG